MNQNHSASPSPVNTDDITMIRKMQQQLDALEKKIDILISKLQDRPFWEKRFSRPFRPSFGHTHRHDKEGPEHGSREKDLGQGRRFEKRHGGHQQGGGQKKKPFFYKRNDRG